MDCDPIQSSSTSFIGATGRVTEEINNMSIEDARGSRAKGLERIVERTIS